MASIILENVVIDFTIYGAQKSFREALFARTGGLLRREKHRRVRVRALDHVNLELAHGDRLGIVGHNGSGKTTLLKVLSGVYEPVNGRVHVEGRLSPLFNTAPGLDPDDTGYENIMTCGLYLGMTPQEIAAKTMDIARFTELGDYLDLPVRTYSTGMQTRLGFGIATAIDPEILVLDEGIGAGDARFAEAAQRRVDSLIDRSSLLVLATHSNDLLRRMCNRALLLDAGKVILLGKVDEVLDKYMELTRQASVPTPRPQLASCA